MYLHNSKHKHFILIYFREYKNTHTYQKYNKKQILLEKEILLEEIEGNIFWEKYNIKI